MMFELAMGSRIRKSPFFDATVKAGVTHFSVYNHMYMPVSYGDVDAEYWRLVNGVSMWDVSVERQVEISGPDAEDLIRYLVPRDLKSMRIGQGKYVPLCDHDGRLINDPVLLKVDDGTFWFSIADSDILVWSRAIAAERKLDVRIVEPDVSPLAVQGPKAETVIASLFGDWVRDLKYFWFKEVELEGIPVIVARSGWSKQGGFEIYLRDGSRGGDLWNIVAEAGRTAEIGPGAPNYIERIESGLLSYGADTDDDTNPFEVGLGKFVDLDRADDFVGKAALATIKQRGIRRQLTGLFIDGDPIQSATHPLSVLDGSRKVGTLSAAAYSPRLERNIAVALLDSSTVESGKDLMVLTEEGQIGASQSALPFL